MSELGRVLRLDARRAALLVTVPLLTGIGIVTVWTSLVPGVAYRDNSVVALINAVRLLGPVAAGLAAWAAVRERGLNYLRDLSPRSPATGALLDLLLLGGAAMLAYGTVTGVVTIETALRQEAGRPYPLGVLAGMAALVLHVVIGYLAARLVPRPATALAVMLVTWTWAALRSPGESWWSLLPPAVLDHVELFTGLRTRVLADQTMCALAATVTLVLAYVGWVTRRAAVAVPLLIAVAMTGIATARLQASGGSAVAPAPVGLACREWPLRVCVHPALRSALPALTAAATPLATRLSGTPGEFTQVVQRPHAEPVAVRGGMASIHLDSDLSPGYEARAVRQIKDALAGTNACRGHGASRTASEYSALVDHWLLGRGTPPISDQRTARRFQSWTEEQRRDWLRANYARYRSCALGPRDFRPVVVGRPADAPRPAPRPVRPRGEASDRHGPERNAHAPGRGRRPGTITPRTPRTPRLDGVVPRGRSPHDHDGTPQARRGHAEPVRPGPGRRP